MNSNLSTILGSINDYRAVYNSVNNTRRSMIHIKKKNRGKFTEYCGGKVTEECIRRGKNSSSPTIRKRATFAANARKWKHQNGGVLQLAEIPSIPNILKHIIVK